MKIRRNRWFLLLMVIAWPVSASASSTSDFCKALRTFVESVGPNDTREFTFRTSWGFNFKDEVELALAAKRCEHGDYAPANKVCEYLMEHGYIEFSDGDVKDAVTCLSRKTKFDPRLSINVAEFSFSYGSANRGSQITITYKPDPMIGGMAFRLVADGY